MLFFTRMKALKDFSVLDNENTSFYSEMYNVVNATAIDGSLSSRILHKSLETGLRGKECSRILELGGNKGEHIKFVSENYFEYVCTDLNLPNDKILQSFDSKIKFEIQNAEKLDFSHDEFDRVIFTCVLHHLSDPTSALKEARRVTKDGGLISIALPNDPGIMYRTLRAATTLKSAKKMNRLVDIQLLHAKEHRNHFLSLEWLIREVFVKDEISKASFPFILNYYNLNAFSIYQILIKK